MDSKAVNRQIKDRIWPLLRTHGFATFSPRTAWRHHADRIDVFNFQSFNSYNASVIGCTTFSFSVNMGCYLLAIPPIQPTKIKQKNGLLLPQEFECHLRGRLFPTIPQPKRLATDIWFIDETGQNLDASIQDVGYCIETNAFEWFQQFQSPKDVLRIFRSEPEHMSRLWGFGRNPSPVRHYFSGYIALSLSDNDLAKEHLEQALASGCFLSVHDRLTDDLRQATQRCAATNTAEKRR